jgi:hypothetical protein
MEAVRNFAPYVVHVLSLLSQGHHEGEVGQSGEALGGDDEGGVGPDFGCGEFREMTA